MTVVSSPLGTPPPAALRGGDCRARDLNQGRNVHGPHRFAATTHCRINNGLLRLTVGAAGAAPALTVEARRGAVTVGDTFVDTFHDTFGGTLSTPAWMTLGTLTIDSPSVATLLTDVRIARVTPEAITIRLVAPLMADAYVSLHRGERHVHVQHGDTRAPQVDVDRRVRLTASPALVGTAHGNRVQEDLSAIEGMYRWVASIDPVTADAATFSLTATSVTMARFGAGAGTSELLDTPASQHAQLGNASRPVLVVA